MMTQASRTHILHAQPRPQQQSTPAPNLMQQLVQGVSLIAWGAVAVAQGLSMIDQTLEATGIVPQCAPDRRSPLR